jgi:hypothetical protein
MATFNRGESDQFGPMQLYKPDYQFLTQVYGTKQATYDRGFNYVKSLYNSVLNSPMTSQDNEKQRQEVFKKIQNTLKEAGTLDLSNPTNIEYANKLIEPISSDREFIYDMSVTSKHRGEMGKLEMTRTSLDPKVSGQYNENSKLAIQFATEDLRNAKRGDGSIFRVKPQEFVPYQDIVGDLNKAAKEQNLNIEVQSATGTGYLVKQSNGKLAYEPYTKWAMQAIGNKYDRQFAQQGYVEAEKMIRSKMQSEAVTREDAIRSFTPMITKALYNEAVVNGTYSDAQIKEHDLKIEKFREKFGSRGIDPNSNAAKELVKLYKSRTEYVNELSKAKADEINLRENGDEYVTSNLYNIFTNEAKKKTALGWAITQADATKKEETTSDATWMGKFREANENSRFNQRLKFDYAKLEQDRIQSEVKNKIDFMRLKFGDGKLGDMTPDVYAGTYTSETDVPATKVLQNDAVAVQQSMFDKVFATSGGLINVLYNNVLLTHVLYTFLSFCIHFNINASIA